MQADQLLRIVFLAVDDEFAGEMQRFVYKGQAGCVVGSVIAAQAVYNRTRIGAALFLLRKSGLRFLAEMVRIKVLRAFLRRTEKAFPSKLAQAHGVEILVTSDINDEHSVSTLRRWQPDLILSTNFNQYIGKPVREAVARYGCWNLHKSLLPNYRGMAPSFHALLEGASRVGATLHVVAKGLDVGDVLTQVELPVLKTDTVYSLNRKTAKAGGRMLASFLSKYDPTTAKAIPQADGPWKNYTYPTREEVSAFRKKGLRFDTWRTVTGNETAVNPEQPDMSRRG